MVSQHIQHDQRLVDVLLRHGAERRQFVLADRLPPRLHEQLRERFPPVLSVTQETKVAERLLRRTQLAFALAELVAEGDEQSPESAPLVLGQRQDTGEVVALRGVLLLGEVSDEMASRLVPRAHAVEQERVNVVVERLVVEEQLAQQAEIPTPGPLASTVDLEEGDVVIAVDLVSGRVDERALGTVSLEGPLVVEVTQTELVDVNDLRVRKGRRVRGEIPRLDLVLAHLQTVQVADAVDFNRVLGHAAACPQLLDLLCACKLFLGLLFRLDSRCRLRETGVGHLDIIRLGLGRASRRDCFRT